MNQKLSYSSRAEQCSNPTAQKLFSLMDEKKTNLGVAADLTRTQKLLDLADAVGSEICALKTHVDILEDFTPSFITQLQALAEKHNFLIFEDRKFADIGNTVLHQYEGGIYRISDWADITNAHIIPGPGIIEGLRKIGLPKGRGLLLLAEMSSQGSLAHGLYTEKAIEMAQQYRDYVIGFICQRKLTDDPCFVHMTPGIQLESGKDALGQQYLTPEIAFGKGTDVILVGRGIFGAKDPKNEARIYRKRAWAAYEAR